MTQIGDYRYEIDENNAVRVWSDANPNEDDAPFFLQPHFPDGTAWTAEQAEEWVTHFISQQP
jgi:hypothetical protein